MEPVSKLGKYIGFTVGVFAIVGVGIGLTGFFPLEYVVGEFSTTEGGQFAQAIGQLFIGVVFLQSIMMAMFTGPTVGGLTGLVSAFALEDRASSVVVGGLGGFVGFYVMVLIAVIVMSMAMPSGGDGGQATMGQATDLSRVLSPILKSGLPTGIVGALTGAVGAAYLG